MSVHSRHTGATTPEERLERSGGSGGSSPPSGSIGPDHSQSTAANGSPCPPFASHGPTRKPGLADEIRASIILTLATLLITGIGYPLLVTLFAQALFPQTANGSLLQDSQGRIVGSELIGQTFTRPEYVHARPSAAGGNGYDPLSSGGSNFGPTSQKLVDRIASEIVRLRLENPQATWPVPLELVTTSGSGLDPHLSPEAVEWQVPRVAAARGLAPDRVRQVVVELVEKPEFGFLGEPRVNVLRLNIALDRRFGAKEK